MESPNTFSRLVQLVADLEEEAVLQMVQERLEAGAAPLAIIAECNVGMRAVGQRYERGDSFVAGLIMSGVIFREVVELVLPILEQPSAGQAKGRALVGTVSGDIHDIDKNIFGMLLACHGFEVIDLGVDVPPFPIIIGGGMIDAQICRYVGADYWVPHAMAGVRLCEELISKR